MAYQKRSDSDSRDTVWRGSVIDDFPTLLLAIGQEGCDRLVYNPASPEIDKMLDALGGVGPGSPVSSAERLCSAIAIEEARIGVQLGLALGMLVSKHSMPELGSFEDCLYKAVELAGLLDYQPESTFDYTPADH